GFRVVAVTKRNAHRMSLRLQLGAARPDIIPRVRLHPDLVPHALAVHGREVDVVVGKSGPGLVILVEGDLPADGGGLAVFLLDGFDEAREVDEEFAVEMRAPGAIPPEQGMARPGRSFCV